MLTLAGHIEDNGGQTHGLTCSSCKLISGKSTSRFHFIPYIPSSALDSFVSEILLSLRIPWFAEVKAEVYRLELCAGLTFMFGIRVGG